MELKNIGANSNGATSSDDEEDDAAKRVAIGDEGDIELLGECKTPVPLRCLASGGLIVGASGTKNTTATPIYAGTAQGLGCVRFDAGADIERGDVLTFSMLYASAGNVKTVVSASCSSTCVFFGAADGLLRCFRRDGGLRFSSLSRSHNYSQDVYARASRFSGDQNQAQSDDNRPTALVDASTVLDTYRTTASFSASQMVATPDDSLTLAMQTRGMMSAASVKLLNELHTRERDFNNGYSVSLKVDRTPVVREKPRASFDAEGNRLPSALWSSFDDEGNRLPSSAL